MHRSRTAASRRRYASLPYGGSTVTFPVHLTYHPSDAASTMDMPEPEFEPDLPALGNPSMQHLHEKLTSSPPASRLPTIRLNPANYISVSRKGTPKRFLALTRTSASIKGKFTVNPYLHVPAALLVPMPMLFARDRDRDGTDGVRKNLKFEVENGGIDVEIFLVGGPDPDPQLGLGGGDTTVLRTTLDLKIRGGPGPGLKKNNFPLIAKIVSEVVLLPLSLVYLLHLTQNYIAHPNSTSPAFSPHHFRTRWLPLSPSPALIPRTSHHKHEIQP